jgi:NTP pyrophosphatase (non-canonical NTP hydrolase)
MRGPGGCDGGCTRAPPEHTEGVTEVRLDLYPLERETPQMLLVRLMEELAEAAKEASKCIRTGPHFAVQTEARRCPASNVERLHSELDDVFLVLAELSKREGYERLPDHCGVGPGRYAELDAAVEARRRKRARNKKSKARGRRG